MNTEIHQKDIIAWAGTSASLTRILSAETEMTGKMSSDIDDDDEGPNRLLSIAQGVATIMVHGSLTSHDAWYNKYFGITSYNDIRNAIIEAAEDEDVDSILLDVDSPGGDAKGVNDLAEFIKMVSTKLKPISSYVSGSAFSAAYWIAAATDRISGPKMAEAGSIGVIAILAEQVDAYKKAGVTIHVFRGGKYKALGNPYEKLSDKGKSLIQAKIDTMEGFFLDAVSEYRNIPRNKVKAQVGEGLTFFAEEAVQNGLMDEIVSFDELFGRLIKAKSSNSAGRNVLSEDNTMGKRVLTAESVAALAAGATEEEVAALLGEQTEAAEEAAETVVDEQASEAPTEDAEAAAETEEAADSGNTNTQVQNNDGLVNFLKGELTTLRSQVSELTKKADKLDAAEANEAALKSIANQFVASMCIPLGITAMDLTGMETPILLTQYEAIRTKFTSKFHIGGAASVQEEDESASTGDGRSPMEKASVNANKI